jgi:hypothetical protein
VVVIHPFHPLAGRRVEILYAKRRGGTQVLVCDAGAGRTMTLPVAWTDRGPVAEAYRLSPEGLVELHVLVTALTAHRDGPDRGGSS